MIVAMKLIFFITTNGDSLLNKTVHPFINTTANCRASFQEIDHRSSIYRHCAADVTDGQTELDRLLVFTFFLADLDPEFDQVQGEILRKDPQLDLDQTFAFVSREAQQRMTMIGAERDSIMVTQRQRGP